MNDPRTGNSAKRSAISDDARLANAMEKISRAMEAMRLKKSEGRP